MDNKIDYRIPEETVIEVLDLLAQVDTKLSPYLISLPPAKRKSVSKMTDRSTRFVEDSLGYCSDLPQFVPPFLDTNAFQNDLDTWHKLKRIFIPVQQLSSKLDDTKLQAGSESFRAARTFYNSIKQAAKMGIPGSKVAYNQLKVLFTNRGNRSPQEP